MGYVPLIMGLSLLLGFGGCVKESGPDTVSVPLSFLPGVTITPSRVTMQRGDTLWLEMNSTDSLFDRTTGKRYRIRPQDIKLRSFIAYQRLAGIGKQPVGIAPTFRLVEKVGKASISGSFTGSFEPVYDGSHYRARIGLIPTEPGVTAISMQLVLVNPKEQFLPFIQLPRTPQGATQLAKFAESVYVINGGKANNFDLFSQHTYSHTLDPRPVELTVIYQTKSTFTVEVK